MGGDYDRYDEWVNDHWFDFYERVASDRTRLFFNAAALNAAAPLAGAPQTSGSLVSVAAAYAHRLGRIKDPPSRLKTLLNDITHRTGNSGLPAEAILEELKRSHGVTVDAAGHVLHPGPAAAPAEAPAAAAAAAPRPHRRRRRRR